jgi:hypothetical protein
VPQLWSGCTKVYSEVMSGTCAERSILSSY